MVTGLHEHTLAVVGCRTGADARMSCQNREKGLKREKTYNKLSTAVLFVSLAACVQNVENKAVVDAGATAVNPPDGNFGLRQNEVKVDHHSFVYTTQNVVLLSKQEEKKQCSASLHSPEVFHRRPPQMTLNTSCVEISNENKIKPI